MLLQIFIWRRTRRRIRQSADSLSSEFGDLAFFRAHELAWIALGRERWIEARFWQAVCGEVCARLRRREVTAELLSKTSRRLPAPERRLPDIVPRQSTIIAYGRCRRGNGKQMIFGAQS